ncbi:MAG TPA: hypothetical protein QKA14_02925 [Candidatus Megaira endosymbiont of Hartmannula sinica]|nr:hypothetical protein [Candidatus Megaera endosymbiont of Hartmannula sinica]
MFIDYIDKLSDNFLNSLTSYYFEVTFKKDTQLPKSDILTF